MIKNKRYNVKSMLSGLVIVITASGKISAIKKGQKYFSEPNRTITPVRIIGEVLL